MLNNRNFICFFKAFQTRGRLNVCGLFCVALSCSFASNALHAQSPVATRLNIELTKKQFFKLETDLATKPAELSLSEQLYFSAFVHNAFNECEKSSSEVEQLLKTGEVAYVDSIKPYTWLLQIDNYVKLYQYKKAADMGDSMIARYGLTMDSAKLADVRNSNTIWRALADVPPQTTVKRLASNVLWKKDAVGLMTVPVIVNGIPVDFVFDTGANISTISESYARKLKLRLIETAFDLGSSTSIHTKATLAVAKTMTLGNAELRNVVFIVLPDAQLSFAELKYAIHGIVGYPVIEQMDEVTINHDGHLVIPEKPGADQPHNLFMDELMPVIKLGTDDGDLSMIFDTGAKTTDFSRKFYDEHKASVEAAGKTDTVNMAGAGGSVKYQTYKLPAYSVMVSGKKVTLNDISVLTEESEQGKDYYDGRAGQDLIGKFGEMTINFKGMWVEFR